MKQNDPITQIDAGNPWYLADQFKSQMGTYGRRKMIQYRWKIFGILIKEWIESQNFHNRNLKVLDAGCGDGINLLGLQTLSNENKWNFDLHGIDYNPIRVERAAIKNSIFKIEAGSLYELPYDKEKFDIILCNHVLEHIPNLTKALQEIRRVLSPRGLFIVGVPNEGCTLAKLRNHVIQRSILKNTDHLHFFTQESLQCLLEGAGFSLVTKYYETFFFPHSYLNMICNEILLGHKVMDFLRKMFPSQAGGLIFSFHANS